MIKFEKWLWEELRDECLNGNDLTAFKKVNNWQRPEKQKSKKALESTPTDFFIINTTRCQAKLTTARVVRSAANDDDERKQKDAINAADNHVQRGMAPGGKKQKK